MKNPAALQPCRSAFHAIVNSSTTPRPHRATQSLQSPPAAGHHPVLGNAITAFPSCLVFFGALGAIGAGHHRKSKPKEESSLGGKEKKTCRNISSPADGEKHHSPMPWLSWTACLPPGSCSKRREQILHRLFLTSSLSSRHL